MKLTTIILTSILITTALMEENAQEKNTNKNILPEDLSVALSSEASCRHLYPAHCAHINGELIKPQASDKQHLQGSEGQQLNKRVVAILNQKNDSITGDAKLWSKAKHYVSGDVHPTTETSSLKRFLY